ncbi:MAG: hypothetical protein GF317_05360 [Candidatus Lokiarchaeota archaeon]|nr:hypothetical protein [Candidatus Lokiarchaeota archaeon]MBD3199235.1 hypothetical protein [Candidatus Lokiarchaeota archaeon]
MLTSKFYVCLECDCEYENKMNLAICPECLEKEKRNYRNGTLSKYETVNMYLRALKDK